MRNALVLIDKKNRTKDDSVSQKKGSGFMARLSVTKKRSIQEVGEHFLPLPNAAVGPQTIFEMC
jgi:hypothetical protein